MAQYKQSEITNIYWASNEGFKGGRDPLGIQNSSIATYSKLLPGLTNLTMHIRYYSLYCWLLSEFDKLEKAGEVTLHQYNFIRRAELAMALIMRGRGIGAIVGAMFVAQEKYKWADDGVYDIADGADYESQDKYWSFKSGALGQYYAGSLIYYELVKIEEGRFYLRNKGKELAEAVRKSIKEDVRELFIECILDGELSDYEIEELESLGIHRIILGTEEWHYLNHLLTKNDGESSLRKETISLLLNDMSKGIKVQDFVRHRFMQVNKSIDNHASFGWYFYYLCEALHYCVDFFFCFILDQIKELHNPPMDTLVQSLVESASSSMNEPYSSLSEWRKNIDESINELYDELKREVNTHNYLEASVCATKLLLRLYTEFETNKTSILKFESENDLRRQRGILSEGIRMYVERYLDYSTPLFIESLIIQIMQEHTVVAIAKMGKNNSDLRKFIHEDGRVILVEQRYPVETSPRIDSLFNFLQDMNYIDSENKLTNVALDFIADYGKE